MSRSAALGAAATYLGLTAFGALAVFPMIWIITVSLQENPYLFAGFNEVSTTTTDASGRYQFIRQQCRMGRQISFC